MKPNIHTRTALQTTKSNIMLQISPGKIQRYGTDINARNLDPIKMRREERV
jgi:hypothetical protein